MKINTPEKLIELTKEAAKEKFAGVVESYFERYVNAIDNKKLTIDMVEEFLGSAQKESEDILKEAANNLMKAAEKTMVEKKRFALIAEKK